MSAVRIRPGPVRGSISAPPSKSYTHRALVIGHLARRPFRVRRPLDADDTRATAAALGRLGTGVTRGKGTWRVAGPADLPSKSRPVLDCRESGTTLRFATALAATGDRSVTLVGSARLSERPIDPLLDALESLGASCRHVHGTGLPIEVRGPLHGGRVTVDASQSSQFASALLLALPTTESDSWVRLAGPVVSEPYLESTITVLKFHGIRVKRNGRSIHVPGGQRVRGSVFTVPGDASSAAYFWVAGAVSGGSVTVRGIDPRWPQADLAVLDLLRAAGAQVVSRTDSATVTAGDPRAFQVDLTDAPDLYPLAGVLAAVTPGTSRIRGAEHVVLKESDRKSATAELASRLGAEVDRTAHALVIHGTDHPRAFDLRGLSDHRTVMSAAVGALAADGPSWVGARESVGKSFPGFWQALAALSGAVSDP